MDKNNFFFDPIENSIKQQKKKQKIIKNEKDKRNLKKQLNKQLIEYPSKHLLQLLLPFSNQIFDFLVSTKLLPETFYNIGSIGFYEILSISFVNTISIIGIIWNVAYVTDKYSSPLIGLGMGIGLILIAYLIPKLFLKRVLSRFHTNTNKIFCGFFILIILFYMESTWAYNIEKYFTDYKDKKKRLKMSSKLVIRLILLMLIILIISSLLRKK